MFGALVVGTLAAVAAQDKDAQADTSLYIDIQVPAIDIQIPAIEIPDLEIYVPGYELYLPTYDFYLPGFDIYLDNLDIDIPPVEVDVPAIDIEVPAIDFEIQEHIRHHIDYWRDHRHNWDPDFFIDTDTTFEVDPNARLELRNHSGNITIRTWNRNAVRVEATHSTDDRVKIYTSRSAVKIRSESRHGHPDIVEYQLTVPKSMALDLRGIETSVSVEGVQNGIRVETLEGSVTVRDCAGEISLRSVEGHVILERSSGRFDLSSVDGGVEIIDVEGEIFVESIDGDIRLESVNSGSVDAQTVDGSVWFAGTVKDDGRYRLTTHDGDVVVAIPEGANVTVSVATFEGDFEAAFPIEITKAEAGRRFSFVLGSGRARLELQTFDGSIRLDRR